MRKFWRWPLNTARKGQALAEYSIIVAIVAVASIAVVTVFGRQIREVLFKSSQQIGGDKNATPTEVQPEGGKDVVNTDINDW